MIIDDGLQVMRLDRVRVELSIVCWPLNSEDYNGRRSDLTRTCQFIFKYLVFKQKQEEAIMMVEGNKIGVLIRLLAKYLVYPALCYKFFYNIMVFVKLHHD